MVSCFGFMQSLHSSMGSLRSLVNPFGRSETLPRPPDFKSIDYSIGSTHVRRHSHHSAVRTEIEAQKKEFSSKLLDHHTFRTEIEAQKKKFSSELFERHSTQWFWFLHAVPKKKKEAKHFVFLPARHE